jgi:hypothetical protein
MSKRRPRIAGGRAGAPLPDPLEERHRPHPQGHPGRIALENTHPFQRELWGRYWIFAHNGNLKDFAPPLSTAASAGRRTDSERAFCWLLQRLRARFGERCRCASRCSISGN